jgi:hypothetical protein
MIGVLFVHLPKIEKGICAECNEEKGVLPFGKENALICHDCATTPENQERTDKLLVEYLDKMLDEAIERAVLRIQEPS